MILLSEKNYMSKWELGCIVFNSLTYKIFTHYSESFAHYGGSAAWLTAVFSGIVFLAALGIILKIYSPASDAGLTAYIKNRCNGFASIIISAAATLYFSFGICYAAYSACTALKIISYTQSPVWYILVFFIIGAVVSAVFGEKSVRRLHSLNTLGVGTALVSIAVLSFRYADAFNIMPIFGKGISSTFGRGLATLFMYSDIAVIFFLPKHDANYSFSKTVMLSAACAVAVNIIVVTALSLNMPYELSEKLTLPVYPLTKTANLGKFPVRLDSIYQIALISSSLLYISLALSIVIRNVKSFSLKKRHIGAAALCLALCLPLCGCYDSKEVEEKAYIIALGIDNGYSEKYRYTFQISNPLESGGSIGAEQKADESSTGNSNENKTVDNIIIEAADYYTALDKLKSHLSKEADVSHIKVIVYSYDVAYTDTLTHSELLLNEREIRPGTNLCLSESAENFLMSVNPTLEESTVRYYELFFRNRNLPYAPVTELRDFVGRSADSGHDAVIPIADENGLSGMGVFSNGILKDKLSGEEVLIYKLLCGTLPISGIDNNNIIKSSKRSDISVSVYNSIPEVNIKIYTDVNNGINFDALNNLCNRAEVLLYRLSEENCDILGIGRYVKKSCLTQVEWENMNWNSLYPNSRFYVKIFTNNVRNTQNLQKP